MHLQSNNLEVASRIAVPRTVYALDNTRPDLLTFRAVGQCLIMWDDIQPTSTWIINKIPKV